MIQSNILPAEAASAGPQQGDIRADLDWGSIPERVPGTASVDLQSFSTSCRLETVAHNG